MADGMTLDDSAAEAAFRAEARAWLAEHVPPPGSLPSLDTADGFAAHRAWERTMADARWSVVSWPEEHGGRGAGLAEWLVFEEEYWAAGAPARVSQNGIFLLAPTLFEFGTDAQKARFLPPMARADEVWCQGWSEPDAGSDLAGIRSRAVRAPADDGWLLSGQKTWASRGAFAEWCFGLFRTDPETERHHGLTYFLVDLASPGVTVRPIPQLDGDPGFAELFFEDVFVPDGQVLGGVGDGWRVAMATASSERGLSLRSPGRYTRAAGRLVELYTEVQRHEPERAALAADAVAAAWVAAESYRLHTLWTATKVLGGGSVGAEASANKVHWSETDLAVHQAALALLGPAAERCGLGAPDGWLDGFLFALAGPIYAGTNEIQRNVVAERLLGLPRH